jgi:hypothetical protein
MPAPTERRWQGVSALDLPFGPAIRQSPGMHRHGLPAALGSPGLSDGVYRAETAIDGYLDGDDHAQQPDRGHRDPPALARAALRAARGRGRCRQVARRPGLGARVHVPERRRRLGRRRRPPLPAVGLLGRPRRHAGQARPAGQRHRACCRRRCRI